MNDHFSKIATNQPSRLRNILLRDKNRIVEATEDIVDLGCFWNDEDCVKQWAKNNQMMIFPSMDGRRNESISNRNQWEGQFNLLRQHYVSDIFIFSCLQIQ